MTVFAHRRRACKEERGINKGINKGSHPGGASFASRGRGTFANAMTLSAPLAASISMSMACIGMGKQKMRKGEGDMEYDRWRKSFDSLTPFGNSPHLWPRAIQLLPHLEPILIPCHEGARDDITITRSLHLVHLGV